MIKIMHLITGLNAGGAETMLSKLVLYMDRRRFENIVVSMTDKGKLGAEIEAQGIHLYSLGMKDGFSALTGMLHLLKILGEKRPQILQTWLYHSDFLGIITGKLMRIPAVVWNLRCSELSKEDHPKSLFLILNLLAKLSHLPKAVIVNSMAGLLAHKRLGYRPAKLEVIPNGFDVNLFHPSQESRILLRQSLGLSADSILIGMVARFNVMKDHANFLNAARLLRKMKSDAHFVLVGQGIDNNNAFLMKQITLLGLNGYVHLLEERNDVHLINAAMDMACSSSYSEGFPSTIGEAMACGVPCVATDAGDSAHIIGDTGIIVPPRNPDALANALFNLLSMEPSARRELGLKARQRIIDNFSILSIVEKYQNLYQKII